jgi:uncharacterized membrane protein
MMRSKSIRIVSIGICGALYAAFGYMTHLGLFTPVIGVVRFWPVIIIPSVFAIVFGPIVGGLGAALGIFISDMMIHGDALLSITVGVPSNLIGFYVLGYLGRRKLEDRITLLGVIAGIGFSLSTIILYLLYPGYFGSSANILFIGLSISCIILTLVIILLYPQWRSVNIASIIGLGVGSLYIAAGVWAYSQFFILPTGETNMGLYAALGWFVWTYFTEIPFNLLLVPPILKGVYKAFNIIPDYQNRASENKEVTS